VSTIDLSPLPAPDDARDGRDLPALADELLSTMASIRRSGRLLARRPVELSTLTASQVDLVRLLRRRPRVSVAEAAEELRLAPNTVSTLVRQLTDGGLMSRSPDAHDRRVARLELTPDMRHKVDAFRDRRIGVLASAMAQLPAADRRRLSDAVGLLGRLAARLPHQEALDG
jgi:DNA-binding MarR family transcriptional regulator